MAQIVQSCNIFPFFTIVWQVAKANAEESDAKYNEVMRKMTMLQAELEKAEDRAKDKESKNAQLEEELKEFGHNVNTLKV